MPMETKTWTSPCRFSGKRSFNGSPRSCSPTPMDAECVTPCRVKFQKRLRTSTIDQNSIFSNSVGQSTYRRVTRVSSDPISFTSDFKFAGGSNAHQPESSLNERFRQQLLLIPKAERKWENASNNKKASRLHLLRRRLCNPENRSPAALEAHQTRRLSVNTNSSRCSQASTPRTTLPQVNRGKSSKQFDWNQAGQGQTMNPVNRRRRRTFAVDDDLEARAWTL
mmetsp:Transcript_3422/g.8037  ORF Transcript_3422/g.8037 Transcript_3422/m.8037 type:complete len:223 (-) Transcript_3422:337-1005(-)